MDLVVTGNDKRRNILFEKSGNRPGPLFRREVVQVCMLHVADHLDSVRTEVIVVSGKLQAGSCDVGYADPSGFNIARIVNNL